MDLAKCFEHNISLKNMSQVKLKPIDQQIIVITGASSGIGLATARLAAEKGAKVVLGARSSNALDEIVAGIKAKGGEAIAVHCDITNREQIEELAEQAVDKFGRIDTWVNNAGLSIYGRLDEVSEEDSRLLFETNFWGIYYGSLVALPYLKEQGGALINLGSEVSETVVPLQGMYSTTKHAVKGFTDALRVEIEEVDKAPISITLIQPTATDTPFPQHAKNYMDQEPKLPNPLDDPEDVAKAIINAAETPTRSKKVGFMSKLNTATAKLAPSLGDKMSAKQVDRQQYDEIPRNPDGILEEPSEAVDGAARVRGSGGIEKK
jgi:short-subunit dehydrogenase